MAEDSRKLFVAGLPDSMTEEVLRQLFEATGGSVVEVSLPKDRATGRPRGFGFVTLSSADEASSAREALDGTMQSGRSISVRPFQAEPPKRGEGGPRSSRDQSAPDRTLYVGNLPYDTTTEEVEELLRESGAGPVVRVNLPTDAEGRRRGFGFVTMGSADAAKSAIEALRSAEVRNRRLVVNLAHPKGERPSGDRGGPSSNRHYSGGGGGGGGGYGGGGGGGGDFNQFGGAPSPPRKTFDDRRRRGAGKGGNEGEGGGGGGGGRRKQSFDKRRYDDWDADD